MRSAVVLLAHVSDLRRLILCSHHFCGESNSFMAKIMIVDDEKLVRWSISNGLRRDLHEVFCAENGEEAMEKAQEEAFDLVITDLKMPGMTGAELLGQLKRLSPDTKVMVLTAFSSELDKETAVKLGACGYIEKPFVVDEIRNMVQSMLAVSR